MRYRPIDDHPEDPRLGRFIPDDWNHIESYPLTALALEDRPSRQPVVIGVNWYREFATPTLDASSGKYWVARGGARTLTGSAAATAFAWSPVGSLTRRAGGTSTTRAARAPASGSAGRGA